MHIYLHSEVCIAPSLRKQKHHAGGVYLAPLKCIFITTSDFSDGALQYAKGLSDKVVLIDGETLANHMIDLSVGVSLQRSYEVKRVDSDYFSEA